ncbi:MAG: hypothetical protein ACFFD1_07545 [Candidatus Thorarchaeota archaeon]
MEISELKVEILKQELENLDSKINHFDNLRWKSKQIALALWVATIGFGLKEHITYLCLIAMFLPLPFWIFDTFYRLYYRGFFLRFKAIRDFLREETFLVKGIKEAKLNDLLNGKDCDFPIPDHWPSRTVSEETLKSETRFITNFINFKQLIFYLPLVLIALFTYLYY